MKTTYLDILESFTHDVVKNKKNTTQDQKRIKTIDIVFVDKSVEKICHDHGVYTIEDAATVTSIKNWFNWSKIRSFHEFKYFTGLKTIDPDAFENSTIKEITLPPNIYKIDKSAFMCTELESIDIPEGVKIIEGWAFGYSVQLTTIKLPATINYIGYNAFSRCDKLTTIYISKGNKFTDNGILKGTYTNSDINIVNLNFDEVNESFTNNVIKKSKNITQEEKRNELFDYVDLGLPSGNLWSKNNYGISDEHKYGEYFTWYEVRDLNCDVIVNQVPTVDDYKELKDNCKLKPTEIDGMKGLLMTSKINGNSIFFPSIGYYLERDDKKQFIKCFNENGYYWSSSYSHIVERHAYAMCFNRFSFEYDRSIDIYLKFSLRTISKKKGIKESFTSRVIKDKKGTTQEDKRNIVSDYVDLGLPSGNLWCKCNYGATNEEDAGEYKTPEKFINLDLGKLSIPDAKDFRELDSYCKREIIEESNKKGFLFTSKVNNNTLFIPFAGYKPENIKYELKDLGKVGFYISFNYNEEIRSNRLIYFYCHYKNLFSAMNASRDDEDLCSMRLVLKKKEIKESFTHKVVKDKQRTSQEEKRESILNLYDITVNKILNIIKKDPNMKRDPFFFGRNFPKMDTYAYNSSISFNEDDIEEVQFGFTLHNTNKKFFDRLYISINSIEECSCVIQEVRVDKDGENDIIEFDLLLSSLGSTHTFGEFNPTIYKFDITSSDLIIKIVENYFKYRGSIKTYFTVDEIKAMLLPLPLKESFTKNIDVKDLESHKNKQIESIKNSLTDIIKYVLMQNFIITKEYKTESTGSVYRTEYIVDYDNFFVYLTNLVKKFSLIWQPEGSFIFRKDEGIKQVSIRDSATRQSFVNMSNLDDSFFNMMSRHSRGSIPYVAKMCNAFMKKRIEEKTLNIIKEELMKKINFDSIFESFTSKVIKNKRDTSQEDKRTIATDYIDLGLPSGTLWCTHNYGAENQEDSGNYYTFPGSKKIEFNIKNEKIPSLDEFHELKDNCSHKWTEINGKHGRLFTSKINGNSIFIPAVGCLQNDLDDPRRKIIFQDDTDGYYWTNDIYENNPMYAYNALLDEKGIGFEDFYAYKFNEYPIRTVISKNEIKESFTNKIINKSNNTTQEDKREILSNYVDL